MLVYICLSFVRVYTGCISSCMNMPVVVHVCIQGAYRRACVYTGCISSCVWISVSGPRVFRSVGRGVSDQCAECCCGCHHWLGRHQHQTDHTRFRRICHRQSPLLVQIAFFTCEVVRAYTITSCSSEWNECVLLIWGTMQPRQALLDGTAGTFRFIVAQLLFRV